MVAATKALLSVVDVEVPSWLYEGEWVEDRHLMKEVFYVLAHCSDDHAYVHEVSFVNDAEAAERLAARVKERGVIDLAHWGFHEFFSLTLEQRWTQEAYHENLHRTGRGDESNGWFSGGHE